MTDNTTNTVTTASRPGEQAFETTAHDATTVFVDTVEADGYCGRQMIRRLRSGVRRALTTTGAASPEQIAHELTDLPDDETDVEPVLRRLEAMSDDTPSADASETEAHWRLPFLDIEAHKTESGADDSETDTETRP